MIRIRTMNNRKCNSQDTYANSIDAVLNQSQEGEISRPESVEEGVFEVNADNLAHAPNHASQQHSLDDTHERLTQAHFDKNDLLAVAENATKKNEQD